MLIRNGMVVANHCFTHDYAAIGAEYDTTNHQYNYDHPEVMRAAGQVEALLGLAGHTQFDRPVRPDRKQTTLGVTDGKS